MTEKRLGKISRAKFGMVGYQECEFGLALTFEMPSSGVGTCISGGWASTPTEHTKWTLSDQTESLARMCREVIETMNEAKVAEVRDLEGIPVELEFDGLTLKDWRILTEVL
jgi:hypothetical protein